MTDPSEVWMELALHYPGRHTGTEGWVSALVRLALHYPDSDRTSVVARNDLGHTCGVPMRCAAGSSYSKQTRTFHL